MHVVIIPDGNRRWACSKGLPINQGHKAGADVLTEIVDSLRDSEIRYLTIWGSSYDNITKRSFAECRFLLSLYVRKLTELVNSPLIEELGVRLVLIGEWEQTFPTDEVAHLKKLMAKTQHHSNKFINVFLSYNGDRDMVSAVSKIISKGILPNEITPDVIKSNLMTAALPPVDLLIRTGGEAHFSTGFMFWDLANAHLEFCSQLFPDFSPQQFHDIVDRFRQIQPRLGE